MTISKYLNPRKYEAGSMNELVKEVRKYNAKSINIFLKHSLLDSRVDDYTTKGDAHIRYEVVFEKKRNITFNQHEKMTQLELIADAGQKMSRLQNKLPQTQIQVFNDRGENIEKTYKTMLNLAHKYLYGKK